MGDGQGANKRESRKRKRKLKKVEKKLLNLSLDEKCRKKRLKEEN
jgi:hypothetical protein